MKDVVKFSVEHVLTVEDIKDILTTAIEGGIDYWACLDNGHKDWKEARAQWKEEHKNDEDPTPCYCDVAYQVIKNGKAVIFYDEEEDPRHEEPLKLTFDAFKKGCSLYTQHTGKDVHNIISECTYDSIDADMIIQFALFGELVYG